MTEGKHTPGKWRISDNGETIKIRESGGGIIAHMCFLNKRGRRTSEEVKASAQLMSLAPEMKEALEGLVADLIERSEIGFHHPNESIRCFFTGANNEPVVNVSNGIFQRARAILSRINEGEAG